MTSYVLTLIGNASSAPLEPLHIEAVRRDLAATGSVNWLADEEACDIFFESPLLATEIAERARLTLPDIALDAVCTDLGGRRKKRLLISDMDSTIIEQECIDELGDAMDVGSQISEITSAAMSGELEFFDALRKRLSLIKGLERHVLKNILEERISLTVGARTLVQTMRHHGAFCVLVSGGFEYFTSRIAERVGFQAHQGNRLAFEDEKLTGEVMEPVLGRSAKLHSLNAHCNDMHLAHSDVLAVGDGANDIEMIKAAGLGVAFHGVDVLRTEADACINHGDLTAILYAQGFRKSEFVLS